MKNLKEERNVISKNVAQKYRSILKENNLKVISAKPQNKEKNFFLFTFWPWFVTQF